MKRLLSILAMVALAGCVTPRMRYLRDDINTLKGQVDALHDDVATVARDQRRLMRNLDDLGNKVAMNDIELKARIERRFGILNDRLDVLEKFKADHDKRWPPPVKLKKK